MNMIANIQAITELEGIQDIGEASNSYQRLSISTGPTKESQVREMCVSMLTRLPPLYDPFTLPERLRALGSLKPIVTFLRQEIERISRLLKVTDEILKNLIDGIDGKIILNERLHDAMDAIYFSKVPVVWTRVRMQTNFRNV